MSLHSRHDDPADSQAGVDGHACAPRYTFDAHLCELESVLLGFEVDWGLNLEPDNQRSHVWSQAQQVAFIEGSLRGTLSRRERLIQFNCPHWDGESQGDLAQEMQIVDGVQRLTAIRRFLGGELWAFGMSAGDFNGTRYDIRRQGSSPLHIAVHAFAWRRDLLQFYLDINSGGTPQRDLEIARVRNLLLQLG